VENLIYSCRLDCVSTSVVGRLNAGQVTMLIGAKRKTEESRGRRINKAWMVDNRLIW